MIYFDILPPIKTLPDADRGKLFTAMLEYAQFGVVPEFDGALNMAWQFILPKLDRDEEAYKKKSVVPKKYAVFCREYRKANPGIDPPSFEEWKSNYQSGSYQPISTDIERYPTTTPTTTPTTAPTTAPTASTKPTSKTDTAGKGEHERENPPSASGDYTKQSEAEYEDRRAEKLRVFEEHLTKKGGGLNAL